MVCNFHAFTRMTRSFVRLVGFVGRCALPAAVLALLLAWAPDLLAQSASASLPDSDRDAPLTIDAGQMKIDSKRRERLLTGGVELTRGSFTLKAAQVLLREGALGDTAVATGGSEQASFQQRRPALNERIDGKADRIEYDTRTETVRLIDKAVLKRWRGDQLAEEVSGQMVVYDRVRETFEVQGSAEGSRVRGVVTPSPKPASDSR
jgi:lipopolysaccharide export system protein LptA